jgi:hypothetical protein
MGTIAGTFDRLEDKFAVIYSDEDQRMFTVSKKLLPSNLKEGSKVILTLENNTVKEIEFDKNETDRAQKRIRTKLDRLVKGNHLK